MNADVKRKLRVGCMWSSLNKTTRKIFYIGSTKEEINTIHMTAVYGRQVGGRKTASAYGTLRHPGNAIRKRRLAESTRARDRIFDVSQVEDTSRRQHYRSREYDVFVKFQLLRQKLCNLLIRQQATRARTGMRSLGNAPWVRFFQTSVTPQ